MEKKNQLKSCCKNSLSSREVVARDLPHPTMLSLLNRKQQPYFMREAEDPRVLAGRANSLFYPSPLAGGARRTGKSEGYIKGNTYLIPLIGFENYRSGVSLTSNNIWPYRAIVGLTPDLYAKQRGFTLIELLVVVLIIGILAAVALPQYKKAVWKSRNTQLKTVAATVNQAEQNYRLANGSFTRHFQELSIDLPLASSRGNACGMSGERDSGRYTSNFEVQLSGSLPIIVWYTSGPYKCAGFAYDEDGNMWCVERDGGTHFPGTAGSFCAKVEKATFSDETTALYDTSNTRFYQLP